MQNKAILFTRLPIAGTCKTRLSEKLSGKECAEITEAFIQDEMCVLKHACDEVIVYYDRPADVNVDVDSFKWLFNVRPNLLREQKGGNIFEKMANAFRESFEIDPTSRYILVGSDIPMLDEISVKEAFRDLETSDVVLRRSQDGGYFLIGLSSYTDIPFCIDSNSGADDVAIKTIETSVLGGLVTTSQLLENKFDCDTPRDLELLIERSEELLDQSSKTYLFLKEKGMV